MIVNNTPVRTSINYGINNFEVDCNFINSNVKNYNNYKIQNLQNNQLLNEISLKQSFPINTNLYKFNKNFSKKIVLSKNTLKPIVINFNLNKNEILFEDLFVEVKQNITANVVIILKSKSKCFHNGFLKLKLCSNSNLNLVVINSLHEDSANLFNHESTLLKNAKLDIKIIDFGSNYSVFSNYSFLKGNGVKSNLQTIYLGKNNNKLDYNFVHKIYGENCSSYINSVGALLNESSKNFKGTIQFCKGSKKSVGNENDFCMLLSNNAKSKALPMLLCNEEDISGNHSTAVGKLNNKQLFYIMSRGLSKQEAVKIIIKAKFSSVLNNLFSNELKNNILKKLDEKIKYEE